MILLIIVAVIAFTLGANPILRGKVIDLIKQGFNAFIKLVKKLITKIKG